MKIEKKSKLFIRTVKFLGISMDLNHPIFIVQLVNLK